MQRPTSMAITRKYTQLKSGLHKGLAGYSKREMVLDMEIVRESREWKYTSEEYQMVCTRLDIAFEVVAMMLHMMALSPTEAGYMTLMEAANEAIGQKGLAIESLFKLKIVAGIATSSLLKAVPGSRFQHRSKLPRISID
ncbi:hypothetical protein Tco_0995690 [Tanacetum coccineum]